MKAARVLFSGYYGFGNAGDEAVLAASVRLLRERLPGLEAVVLSADPAATERDHPGLAAAPRLSLPGVAREIRRADVVLSGGGSLLQDRTSLRSLLYYLSILFLARRLGRPAMVFAQGIGPLGRPAARRLTAKALRGTRAITVRDAASAALLREIGVTRPEPEVTADPVFALPPEETERVAALAGEGRPRIGIALRPWPGAEGALEAVAAALGRVRTESGGAEALFWPLHRGRDLPLAERAAERVPGARVVREALRPGEWLALAGCVDAVLSVRLHGLIFAAVAGTPAVALAYDPKVDALRKQLGLIDGGQLAAADAERLAAALREALAWPAAERAALRERVRERAAAAARNAAVAAELLGVQRATGG